MASARAVIYCRCSTEEESQVDALHNQVVESEVCVREQGWSLVDRYVESKSGTTTKGRTEYNRLFEDLLLDRFDIIVIKSQDRLMRNVKDWYPPGGRPIFFGFLKGLWSVGPWVILRRYFFHGSICGKKNIIRSDAAKPPGRGKTRPGGRADSTLVLISPARCTRMSCPLRRRSRWWCPCPPRRQRPCR